ncbi:MAG: rnaSA3 [Mucilaginibacter sp.]|nr:rnaSA3 [Mucilaginibacter sp.]
MKKQSFLSLKPAAGRCGLTVSLLLTVTFLYAQTNTNNYVITNTPRIGGIINDSTLAGNASDKTKVQIAIQYVDGLGRPIQTVQKQASPLGYDIILPQAYDQYGREVTKYLPYTPQSGTSGSFRPNAVSTDQNAFYVSPPGGSGVSSVTDPFAQTNFDNSPLNRPVEQGAPGVPWQLGSHTIKMVYTLNNATAWSTDSVNSRQAALYYTTINSDNSQTITANGYYAANTLTVTISKDENWVSGRAGTVEEYKDIDGHVVLKRVYNYTGGILQQLSTYYVYDDLEHLAFVLPPLSGADGAGTILQPTLDNLCYQYQYDERGRMVQKKIPGKGWEYTVYNGMDQLVATQDANQRTNSQWIFTKYDAQQRPVTTGIWNNGGTGISRASLQNTLTMITANIYEAAQTTGSGYTNAAWPTSNVTATLNLNYYDSYANAPGLPSAYNAPIGANLGARGELVAGKTAVLNTVTDVLWGCHYFDNWGRNIKTYAQHYLGGTANTNNYDAISTTYDFTNDPTTTTRQHWTASSTSYPLVTVANMYIYDQVSRKLKTWEQITNTNNSPTTRTLISKTDYNEIGQLVTKHLHSTDSVNFYQNVTYTYNERGWLLTSSAPLFAMQLFYNTGSPNKQYNGNIAYQYFGTPGNLSNLYLYTYDKLNRLTGGTSVDNNNETGITYDLMGNITALNRYNAGGLIDQLVYNYTNSSGYYTNQLQTISDNSGNNAGIKAGTGLTYIYDGNGNVTTDPSRYTGTINIGYNLFNLSQNITGGETITYTYDAAGNKLRRVSTGTGNRDYINGIQYDAGALSFIQTEEGKALPVGATYNYEYYLGDNLGNTRVSFTSAGLMQQDDYYPFGMEIFRTANGTKNEYLYNKKELQEELVQYDYGARFYDPVIARWTTVDPLAETSRRWSPYNYVENDPIRMIDPDGMEGLVSDQFMSFFGLYNGEIPKAKPTPKEAQQIAAVVSGVKGAKLIGGWKLSRIGDGYTLNDPKTGLRSATFEKTVNNKTEYVFATAGTDPGSLNDIIADLAQPLGLSKQYAESVSFARKLSDQLRNSELTMVGFSKGGSEAAADALATGRDAITFNAAGVSGLTKESLQLNQSAKIDNYTTKGQILDNLGFKVLGLGAEGTQHSIGSSSFINNVLRIFSPAVGMYEGIKQHYMEAVRKAMSN